MSVKLVVGAKRVLQECTRKETSSEREGLVGGQALFGSHGCELTRTESRITLDSGGDHALYNFRYVHTLF